MNGVLQRRARTLVIACACSFGAAVPAGRAIAAEPVSAAPATTPAEADRLFEEGVAAQKAGKLVEAEGLFLRAWAAKKTWDIAANLGLVQLKQGKLAEGAGRVAYAIANLPPTESDTTRERLSKAFDAARPDIAEVKVSCDVDGASVRAGGKLMGTTPLASSFFAAPGSLTIEVTKDGYEAASKTIEIKKGGSEDVKLTLVVKSPPERSKVPAYVIGGVGVAGLIAGGVLVGQAETAGAQLVKEAPRGTSGELLCWKTPAQGSATKPECDAWRSKLGSASTGGNAGVGLLIGGGVAVAGAAAYWLWAAREPIKAAQGRSWTIVPILGNTSVGALWSGNF